MFDLFTRPAIARPAAPARDTVFFYGGRALRVYRVFGDDDAAPVIVEELTDAATLRGQFALWSVAGVRSCIGRAP